MFYASPFKRTSGVLAGAAFSAGRRRRALGLLEGALAAGLACALAFGAWSLAGQRALSDKVVRLHILADSDAPDDQARKLRVRDAVAERTEELLRSASSRAEAEESLRAALPELQALARETLAAAGCADPVTAELRESAFPTRNYGGFTLPAGRYLALRVVIGAGEGRNWWCVVFPPLCAAATTDLAQTAMAAGFTEEDVSLVTEEGGYVLKFKAIELLERLRSRLERP